MPCGRSLALLGLLWWWSVAAPAEEEIEPIDAQFLEYLAELEGAEEDWTLFEREEPSKKPREVEAAKPPPKPRAPQPAASEPSKEPSKER